MEDLKKKIAQGIKWLYKTRQPKDANVDHFGIQTEWDKWHLSFCPLGDGGFPVVILTPIKDEYRDGLCVNQATRKDIEKIQSALEKHIPVWEHWKHTRGGVSFRLEEMAPRNLLNAIGKGLGKPVIPEGFI